MAIQRFIFQVLVGMLFTSGLLQAYEPFHARARVGSESAFVDGSNIPELTHNLRTASLEQLLPIYTPTSALGVAIDLRGIHAFAAFAANSTALQFSIPDLDINKTFTGATRDDSVTLLKDFLRENAGGHLLKAYAKFSPIDPIAGNPNSLMSQMAVSDYAMGRLSPCSGCDCCWSAQPLRHQLMGGKGFVRGFSKKFDTTLFPVPLRYSFSWDNFSTIILDIPTDLYVNGGAYSLFGSFGLGWRVPITHDWSLTPIVRFGIGGSFDLACLGSFVSTGLTSNYDYKIGSSYVLSMTNYAGYFASVPFHTGGFNFNYHLYNFVFKNGLTLTDCDFFRICGRRVGYNFYVIDTEFTGSSLFIERYNDIGFNLFASGIFTCMEFDTISLGFSCQFGEKDYHGVTGNLSYHF